MRSSSVTSSAVGGGGSARWGAGYCWRQRYLWRGRLARHPVGRRTSAHHIPADDKLHAGTRRTRLGGGHYGPDPRPLSWVGSVTFGIRPLRTRPPAPPRGRVPHVRYPTATDPTPRSPARLGPWRPVSHGWSPAPSARPVCGCSHPGRASPYAVARTQNPSRPHIPWLPRPKRAGLVLHSLPSARAD
jgi:hypothetical protein